MNNFKDYLNFSSNLADNLYRMRLIALQEAKKKKSHKKEDKKADKDYDGDGEVESGSEEYLGSRSNAIKKAVAKRKGKELEEQTKPHGIGSFGASYPSEEFAKLHKKFAELNAHHQLEPNDQNTKAARDAALQEVLAHPDYDAYDQSVNRNLGIEGGQK